MEIPRSYHVHETAHWLINHRLNSALPGYLMVGTKHDANDLSKLSGQALAELGPLLAQAEAALRQTLEPARIYIGRYGHSPGYPVHFHVIPVYAWVESLFWQDSRYRALENFAEGPGETATDGAELTFFIWREFCERAIPPSIQGPSVTQAIDMLRPAFRASR